MSTGQNRVKNKTKDLCLCPFCPVSHFKKPAKSKQSSHSGLTKSRKIFIGWLHKSGEKYKQVRFKEGGGIRDISVTEDESISVDALIKKNSSFLVEPERRACPLK